MKYPKKYQKPIILTFFPIFSQLCVFPPPNFVENSKFYHTPILSKFDYAKFYVSNIHLSEDIEAEAGFFFGGEGDFR